MGDKGLFVHFVGHCHKFPFALAKQPIQRSYILPESSQENIPGRIFPGGYSREVIPRSIFLVRIFLRVYFQEDISGKILSVGYSQEDIPRRIFPGGYSLEDIPGRIFPGGYSWEEIPGRIFQGKFTQEDIPGRIFPGGYQGQLRTLSGIIKRL